MAVSDSLADIEDINALFVFDWIFLLFDLRFIIGHVRVGIVIQVSYCEFCFAILYFAKLFSGFTYGSELFWSKENYQG